MSLRVQACASQRHKVSPPYYVCHIHLSSYFTLLCGCRAKVRRNRWLMSWQAPPLPPRRDMALKKEAEQNNIQDCKGGGADLLKKNIVVISDVRLSSQGGFSYH